MNDDDEAMMDEAVARLGGLLRTMTRGKEFNSALRKHYGQWLTYAAAQENFTIDLEMVLEMAKQVRERPIG